jgi:glyoxylase-like metal-dependent hydrolase (beta-lactamase superfamily II)
LNPQQNLTQTLRVGEAVIFIVKVGDFYLRLGDVIQFPEKEPLAEAHVFMPSNVTFVNTGSMKAIIDPNNFLVSCPPGSSEVQPGYPYPPQALEQIQNKLGVKPEEITHVLITHAHFDHFSEVTMKVDGTIRPTYPNAKYFLGKADWEDREIYETSRGKEISETLGVIRGMGMLTLMKAKEIQLGEGLAAIASPGETRGHYTMKVSSGDKTIYFVGDLFHSPVEIEHPEWMPKWATRESNLASRKETMQRAAAEKIIIAPAHMEPGRIEMSNGKSGQYAWSEL